MRLFALLALTVLSSTVYAANTLPASAKERQLLCTAVEILTEIQGTDFALDKESCLKTEMVSQLFSEGARNVIGKLKFNAPDRPEATTYECAVAYIGQPKLEKIIAGVEAGVLCAAID